MLAAAAGVGVGHLVAAIVAPQSSPVLAVGSTIIDSTPTPVKEWAIRTFGALDKVVLLGSVTLVTAVLAALVGLLGRARRGPAVALIVLLPGLTTLAAILRPGAALVDALAGLAAMGVGALAFTHLLRSLDGETRESSVVDSDSARRPSESPLDHSAHAMGHPGRTHRRQFILGAGATGAGALLAGGAGQAMMVRDRAVADVALPTPAGAVGPLPIGLEATTKGISPLRTPTESFYRVDTALTIPRVDPTTWTLTIDGMVAQELTVTYDDILGMDLVERDITLNCVSNEVGGPYIGSARWTGVPVRALLERVGIDRGVDQILSTSVDGMNISTPVQALLDDREALLVVGMDGRPLPAKHGFPVRLLTPGLYGFVGATKWLERLTATTYAAKPAYWTERDWATDAPVRTQSRIDTPKGLGGLRAGQVAIGGVAWSQAHQGIRRVEVRVDDGPWVEATLGPEVGAAYWRQWSMSWEATRADTSSPSARQTARAPSRRPNASTPSPRAPRACTPSSSSSTRRRPTESLGP